MPYTLQQSIQDEHDADSYERSRIARARRAHERNELNVQEFERELFEATREGNNMRAAIIHKLIHSK